MTGILDWERARALGMRPFLNYAAFKPRVYRSDNPDPWRAEWLRRDGALVQADRGTWESAVGTALRAVEMGLP